MKNSFNYYGLVFLSLFLFSCSEWSQTDIKNTIDIGNDISTKLEVYKSNTGSYPSDLSKLIPNHLLKLDNPSVGNKTWDYEVDGEGYYLGVNGENTEFDLSPKFKTMTLMRFPINWSQWRSQNEKTLHRRTNHQSHQAA